MAEFYKGFTFECDVKGRLTIEGNPVQVVAAPDDGVDLGCSADDGTRVALRARTLTVPSSPGTRG